ncbi:MAG: DUF4153 domain-containing protein [Clostridia bacterium]|nr:DUF4153 domain-containing protein [Clostridia bacterium]
MNTFKELSIQLFRRGTNTFKYYPASMLSALGFALVTIVRIHLEWSDQEAYNFIFNCLHWTFAAGAVVGLMAKTLADSRPKWQSRQGLVSILALGFVMFVFLLLYFFGSVETVETLRYQYLSHLAISRVMVLIYTSLLCFILLAAIIFEPYDFSGAFFMTHKALFIAFIYGGVILAGASGIAGAVENLLYADMSEKVYMYIATVVGFLTFTLFVGYFPDFQKEREDPHREVARSHPRFIEGLFNYILIPIIMVLTIVLLIWTVKALLSGVHTDFIQIESIATAYAVCGLWLYIFLIHYTSPMARFYRLVYPIAAILILAVEAWTLVKQLQLESLKDITYNFTLVWLCTFSGVLLLLFLKERAQPILVFTVMTALIVSVLPVVGAHALPVTAQIHRLERLLIEDGMLVAGVLTPASEGLDDSKKEGITDAVLYLAGVADARLPAWFDRDLIGSSEFERQLGFKMKKPNEVVYRSGDKGYVNMTLEAHGGALDIRDYEWMVGPNGHFYEAEEDMIVEGDKGTYVVSWMVYDQAGAVPLLRITSDGVVLLEADMNGFLDTILKAYPPGDSEVHTLDIDEMTTTFETEDLDVMLVFDYISIYLNPEQDNPSYGLTLNGIYMHEK